MSDRTIETLLDEERRFPPDPEFAAQANAQPELYDADPDAFWDDHVRGPADPAVVEEISNRAAETPTED